MKVKRREFLGFFLFGGLASLLLKWFAGKGESKPKEAMFWRRKA